MHRYVKAGLACAASIVATITNALDASAQESLTAEAKVYPLMQQGELTGCQLAFSVLRYDREFSNGRPAMANGLIIFEIAGRVSMRLGVASDENLVRFIPPARAYLYGAFKSNKEDFVQRADSTEQGFALFIFKLGQPTTDMILRLMDKGSIDIMYAPPNTAIEARFTFDLASQEGPYAEYMDCMGALFDSVE